MQIINFISGEWRAQLIQGIEFFFFFKSTIDKKFQSKSVYDKKQNSII